MESWEESDAGEGSVSDSEEDIPVEFIEKIPHSSSDESDEEELDVRTQTSILSTDKKFTWSTELSRSVGRACADNIIRDRVGITYYASSRIASIKDAFLICFPETLRKIIIKYTNVEGLRVYGNGWKDIDDVSLQSYFGLLVLAGVYKSHGESLESLWSEESGRSIFRSTMSLKQFKKLILLVQYVPKKCKIVNALNTLHHDKSVLNEGNKLPEIISFYNKTKAEVDTLDQLVGTYTVKRKTNRWPQALFCNMIDISAVNAYVLWQEMNNDWNKGKLHKRRLFLHELGMELVKAEIQRRPHLPRSDSAITLANIIRLTSDEPSTSSNGKRRKLSSGSRCEICPKNDRKAYSSCATCQKFICGQHKIAYFVCSNCNEKN